MFLTTLFRITDSVIEISGHCLARHFTVYHREILLDVFYKKYTNQQIEVDCSDGEYEHLRHNGFWHFLEYLCEEFCIPKQNVLITTTHKNFSTVFSHRIAPLHVFGRVHNWLQGSENNLPGPVFDTSPDADARLLACTIGRFSIPRLCLMYELDKSFSSNDLLLIYSNTGADARSHLNLLDCHDQYVQELDWLYNRTFDQDDPDISDIDINKYNTATDPDRSKWLMRYHKLWPKYHIDVVAETDVFTPGFFTEKTSRCLATGKPFVLLGAPNSLVTLRDMGFVTFGDIVDESYDQERLPSRRIQRMIQSLQQLNQSSQRNQLLQKLHQQAQKNIICFQRFVYKYDNLPLDNIPQPDHQLV